MHLTKKLLPKLYIKYPAPNANSFVFIRYGDTFAFRRAIGFSGVGVEKEQFSLQRGIQCEGVFLVALTLSY